MCGTRPFETSRSNSPLAMKFIFNSGVVLICTITLPVSAQVDAVSPVVAATLSPVVITASKVADSTDPTLGASVVNAATIGSTRAATSDSARLLQDVPGVSLYGAGGVSSLPAIHGLADDRLRIQVDGMDLMAACPNHMNSVLSYIDPTKVGSVKVFAGITPVSVGGDSIGGSIQVKSADPVFAKVDEIAYAIGSVGAFYRSNGKAHGYNVGAIFIGQNLNLNYTESHATADNYTAATGFKAAGTGQTGGRWLDSDTVGSTAFTTRNQDVGIALQHGEHLLQLNAGLQNAPFEGFPNQRMDMTSNQSTQVNLRYQGQFAWGDLQMRWYGQDVRHKMDMGPDRFDYGTGMPMVTTAKTNGGAVQSNVLLSDADTLRSGLEYQTYTLHDWWPPVGGTMGPNAFWNVDFGQRDKVDAFVEWERRWGTRWTSQLGIRSTTVDSNAAQVQGYDNGLVGLWGNEADAFNALERKRTDRNWDLTALTRLDVSPTQAFEWGYARKSRTPNLYQRYPWSTQAMAALMNNFVGDGNGYVGNVDLKPEVAHTISATGEWSDAPDERQRWSFKATGYFTYVQDYIDARRCDFGQCAAANATASSAFVLLQYANQSAQLYGLDLSGQTLLGQSDTWGRLHASGVLNYVVGENRITGDKLYNLMPANIKLALKQVLNDWNHTVEWQGVAAKTQVSQVHNEIPTPGYGLLNVRSTYERKGIRLDLGVENVFNQFYSMPLGGAYVGQGASMTTKGIAWGTQVPGMGRSLNLSVRFNF